MDFVLKQAKEIPGFSKEDGSSIFTTLDPDMQQAAQAAVHKGLEELEKKFKRLRPRGEEDQLQAALIALDPSTGSVRALVGGRDYQVSQFNRVVQARRQPGSLFKPFVYLTAFGKRDLVPPITPASLYVDSPIALVWGTGEDETWSPKNYDGEYRGTMTARQALEQSINIPTVRIAVTETAPGRTLLPDIVETARRAGISSPLKPYPSLALGSFETSPMEIASAFCTFANGGFRVKPNALLGLVTPSLRRMESKDEPIVRGADADAVSVLDSVLQGRRGPRDGRLGAAARGAGHLRGQDRDDERRPRRVVRRLLAEPPRRGLGRLRRQPRPEPLGLARGAADLGGLRAPPPVALVRDAVPEDARRRDRVDRPDDGPPRDRGVPRVAGRGLPRGDRAEAALSRTAAAARAGPGHRGSGQLRLTLPPLDLDLVVRSHGWYDLPPFEWDAKKRTLGFRFLEGEYPVQVVVAGARERAGRVGGSGGGRALFTIRRKSPVSSDVPSRAAVRACAGSGLRSPSRTLLLSFPLRRRSPLRVDRAARGGAHPARADAVRGRREGPRDDELHVGAHEGDGRGTSSRASAAAGRFRTRRSWPGSPARELEKLKFGYRAPYLAAFADRVASGALDLARWEDLARPDEDVEKEIRAEKGFGPYAADTLGRLLGRHGKLGLDSWSRKKVSALRFRGRKVSDARVARLYAPFGAHAGLAFWLDVTRDWHEEKERLWP